MCFADIELVALQYCLLQMQKGQQARLSALCRFVRGTLNNPEIYDLLILSRLNSLVEYGLLTRGFKQWNITSKGIEELADLASRKLFQPRY